MVYYGMWMCTHGYMWLFIAFAHWSVLRPIKSYLFIGSQRAQTYWDGWPSKIWTTSTPRTLLIICKFWGLNWVSQACSASTLLPGPSSQSRKLIAKGNKPKTLEAASWVIFGRLYHCLLSSLGFVFNEGIVHSLTCFLTCCVLCFGYLLQESRWFLSLVTDCIPLLKKALTAQTLWEKE